MNDGLTPEIAFEMAWMLIEKERAQGNKSESVTVAGEPWEMAFMAIAIEILCLHIGRPNWIKIKNEADFYVPDYYIEEFVNLYFNPSLAAKIRDFPTDWTREGVKF